MNKDQFLKYLKKKEKEFRRLNRSFWTQSIENCPDYWELIVVDSEDEYSNEIIKEPDMFSYFMDVHNYGVLITSTLLGEDFIGLEHENSFKLSFEDFIVDYESVEQEENLEDEFFN